MDYQLHTDDNTVQVQLSGRLQFEDHNSFKSLIQDTLPKMEQKTVVFNLSQMDFIDSSGIGMILLAHETIKEHGKNFSISSAQGQVKRVLDLTRIEDLISSSNTIESTP